LAGLSWLEFAIQNKSQYCRASILISGFGLGEEHHPVPRGRSDDDCHEMDVT
jgi:hypothetical protein